MIKNYNEVKCLVHNGGKFICRSNDTLTKEQIEEVLKFAKGDPTELAKLLGAPAAEKPVEKKAEPVVEEKVVNETKEEPVVAEEVNAEEPVVAEEAKATEPETIAVEAEATVKGTASTKKSSKKK